MSHQFLETGIGLYEKEKEGKKKTKQINTENSGLNKTEPDFYYRTRPTR